MKEVYYAKDFTKEELFLIGGMADSFKNILHLFKEARAKSGGEGSI